MSDRFRPDQTNYIGGDQINQTGSGNVGKIVQSAPSDEYVELIETLRVQITTMLQLDEFAHDHSDLKEIKVVFDAPAAEGSPTPRLKEATKSLRAIASGTTSSALAQVILSNASRFLALLP